MGHRHDAQEYLRLELVRADDPIVWTARFGAVSSRTYTLLTRGGFTPGDAWRPVADVIAMPTNRIVEIIQKNSESTRRQIFQLVTPRFR